MCLNSAPSRNAQTRSKVEQTPRGSPRPSTQRSPPCLPLLPYPPVRRVRWGGQNRAQGAGLLRASRPETLPHDGFRRTANTPLHRAKGWPQARPPALRPVNWGHSLRPPRSSSRHLAFSEASETESLAFEFQNVPHWKTEPLLRHRFCELSKETSEEHLPLSLKVSFVKRFSPF